MRESKGFYGRAARVFNEDFSQVKFGISMVILENRERRSYNEKTAKYMDCQLCRDFGVAL